MMKHLCIQFRGALEPRSIVLIRAMRLFNGSGVKLPKYSASVSWTLRCIGRMPKIILWVRIRQDTTKLEPIKNMNKAHPSAASLYIGTGFAHMRS